MVEHNDDNSDDEVDVYTTEFVWSSKAKPYMCNALKPIRKNRDEEMRFTFDISKCEKMNYGTCNKHAVSAPQTAVWCVIF